MDQCDIEFVSTVRNVKGYCGKEEYFSKSILPVEIYDKINRRLADYKIEYDDFMKTMLVIFWLRYAQSDEVKVPLVNCESHMAEILSVDCTKSITFHKLLKQVQNKEEVVRLQQNSKNTEAMEFVGGVIESSRIKNDIDLSVSAGKNILLIERGFAAPHIYAINTERQGCTYTEQMIVHFVNLIASVLLEGGYEKDIFSLEMMGSQEMKKIICEWNLTQKDFPDKCIHELFEDKVREKGDAAAVIYKEKEYSRQDIEDYAERITQILFQEGVKKGEVVAVYLEKSVDFVASVLSILKAGAAYLPIDVTYPSERVAYIVEDADVKHIITRKKYVSYMKHNTGFIYLEDKELSLAQVCSEPVREKRRQEAGDLCYVIYTSGSTGNPKGVMLNHRGRVNNFCDFNERFHIGEGDKLLAVSSPGFDMCAYDILGTLAAGAAVILPDPEMGMQPMYWLKLIEKYKITVWHSVPVMLELLCKCAEVRKKFSLETIRLFLLGGDWIPVNLPEEIRRYSKGIFVSLGGATEVSMDSIIYIVDKIDQNWKSIPYGKPMYNQKAYILGRHLEPLPAGVLGELYIGGIGVGEGYLHKPELTAEKFLPNRWCCGERIYKTGDIARFYQNGNIELLGRKDQQIKINGVRIELGEIEEKLKRKDSIKDAVAVAVDGENHKKRILAYVIPEESGQETDTKLYAYLSDKLPKAFIPSEFIFLKQFPITPNGKINRKKLAEMADEKERMNT